MTADVATPGRSYWRYQPVYREQDGERLITLCECSFDAEDRLIGWTENPAMTPVGDDPEELAGALTRMLAAVRAWRPVAFDSLQVGQRFLPASAADPALRAQADC